MKKLYETFKNVNWATVKPAAIVRALLTLLVIMNYILGAVGLSPVSISEGEIANAVNTCFTIVIICWGFWKNNAFSSSAQIGQDVTQKLKDGQTLKEVIDGLSDKLDK